MSKIECQVHNSFPIYSLSIDGSTDLPPLTLAVVLPEKTLVVRNTVLPEHKSVDTTRGKSISHAAFHCINPAHHAIMPSDKRLETHPPTSGIVRGARIVGIIWRNIPGHARNGAIHRAGCGRKS